MVVGVLRLELVLHAPLSLKEKRGTVQKLLNRCRRNFPVSGAEIGAHDLWQRCELAFTMVSNDRALIDSVFAKIEAELERSGEAEICSSDTDLLDY